MTIKNSLTHTLITEINSKPYEINPVCNQKHALFQCRTTQPFRVARGKSTWRFYELGDNQRWNLREVLSSEVVIEFDMPKSWKGTLNDFQNEVSWPAINFTGINLCNAQIPFEIWDHEGKSPHIHIRNLPIAHLPKDKLREFKKFFARKFVPSDYHPFLDDSLAGIHLVALEWVNHWKGKYGIKKLVHRFEMEAGFHDEN